MYTTEEIMAEHGAATRPNDDEAADSDTPLEIFDLAGADGLDLYFYRIPREGERRTWSHGYVYRCIGEPDMDTLQQQLGGGRYTVLAKKGRTMVDRATFEIAGAPRPVVVPDPPAAAPDDVASLRAELAALKAQRAPASDAITVRDLLPLLMKQQQPAGMELFPLLISTLEKGISLGERGVGAHEGGGESETAQIIRAAADSFAAISGRAAAAPPAVGPPPPATA